MPLKKASPETALCRSPRPAPSGDLAVAIREVMGVPDHPISYIGTRHGEKLYETLVTKEEMAHAVDLGEYYKIPPITGI